MFCQLTSVSLNIFSNAFSDNTGNLFDTTLTSSLCLSDFRSVFRNPLTAGSPSMQPLTRATNMPSNKQLNGNSACVSVIAVCKIFKGFSLVLKIKFFQSIAITAGDSHCRQSLNSRAKCFLILLILPVSVKVTMALSKECLKTLSLPNTMTTGSSLLLTSGDRLVSVLLTFLALP